MLIQMKRFIQLGCLLGLSFSLGRNTAQAQIARLQAPDLDCVSNKDDLADSSHADLRKALSRMGGLDKLTGDWQSNIPFVGTVPVTFKVDEDHDFFAKATMPGSRPKSGAVNLCIDKATKQLSVVSLKGPKDFLINVKDGGQGIIQIQSPSASNSYFDFNKIDSATQISQGGYARPTANGYR